MKIVVYIFTSLVFSQFAFTQQWISSTNPEQNAIGHPHHLPIKVSFAEQIDPLSFNANSIMVFGSKRGKYEVVFDAARFASGLYYYRLSSGKNNAVRKMLLLK